MAEADSPESDTKKAAPAKGNAGRSITGMPRGRRTKKEKVRRPQVTRTFMSVEEAAHWFIGDLLEVSGFVRPHMRHRSGYSHYRPVLTKPDPVVFRGSCRIESPADHGFVSPG